MISPAPPERLNLAIVASGARRRVDDANPAPVERTARPAKAPRPMSAAYRSNASSTQNGKPSVTKRAGQ